MRILHFSDLHIGVENYGRIDPATGLSTRLGDFLASLDEVVEFSLNENVDLVLLAGDAYKGRDPSQTHQRELAKRLFTLTEAGIQVFLLVGNHDLPNATSRATAAALNRRVSKNSTVSAMVSSRQQGSGSRAKVMDFPVFSLILTKWTTCLIRLSAMASTTPSLAHGLKVPGTVLIEPSIPSGNKAARISARELV